MNTAYRKQSFFDFIMGKPRKTVAQFANPLGIKPSSSIRIDTLELMNHDFRLDPNNCDRGPVMEYRYTVPDGEKGREYVFTDYCLLARPDQADDIRVKLRISPIPGSTGADGKAYDYLLLTHDYGQGWEPDLAHELAKAVKNKTWTVSGEGKSDVFLRVNGASHPYDAKVGILNNDFTDGRTIPIQFVDFGREVDAPGGFKINEFYIVETVGESRYFHMWRGVEINESRVTVV